MFIQLQYLDEVGTDQNSLTEINVGLINQFHNRYFKELIFFCISITLYSHVMSFALEHVVITRWKFNGRYCVSKILSVF